MSLRKIKAILMVILLAVMCLGAWVFVTSDTVIGAVIIGAGFVSWCILSMVCPNARWF